ncbi:MAG: hypothetical protein AAGK38_08070, partial [Pseudomonadota bacterium]
MTPWLAANLDRISKAVGIPLEEPDTEVPVEGFAADILAYDPVGDRKVLIENQLERSDHTHLGQIMTYLAGLETSVMIWIAAAFREPHLAAIRWLNENTNEPFAFFAVKLRAVRIGSSLPAPLFEVVERPNDWERQVNAAVRKKEGLSEIGKHRLAFWTHLAERHPELNTDQAATSSIWIELTGEHMLVLYKSSSKVGVFVRGERGSDHEQVVAGLAPYASRLNAALGVEGDALETREDFAIDTTEPKNWDRATDWLATTTLKWKRAFHSTIDSVEKAA